MWLIFLAINIIVLTAYNLILRKSLLQKIDSFTLATIMQTGIAIPMVILSLFFYKKINLLNFDVLILGIPIIISIIALHLCNVKSLQYLEASVYSVLYNLRIILVTIFGILFLSEEIIPLQMIGGSLIFVAIFIIKQKGKKE